MLTTLEAARLLVISWLLATFIVSLYFERQEIKNDGYRVRNLLVTGFLFERFTSKLPLTTIVVIRVGSGISADLILEVFQPIYHMLRLRYGKWKKKKKP